MARSGKVSVPKRKVTELTNANVSGLMTFQLRDGNDALLIGTADATEPLVSAFVDGLALGPGLPAVGYTLAEIFPGAGYVRLWAYSEGGCTFAVYHG